MNLLKSHHFKNLTEQKATNESIDTESEPIYNILDWYPNELALQVNLTRKNIRKNEELIHLKQFLIDQTESGNLNRQEAVSMIPPLLLKIKSHHKILDMCAAPGSKTAQLIEFLHSDCNPGVLPGIILYQKEIFLRTIPTYTVVFIIKRDSSLQMILITNVVTYSYIS